ncbi:PREDICTED: embryo defective 2410, partial [Prunus dulcis]
MKRSWTAIYASAEIQWCTRGLVIVLSGFTFYLGVAAGIRDRSRYAKACFPEKCHIFYGEVPRAEVAEMLSLARLVSRSTDPAVHSRSKDLFIRSLQSVGLYIESLKELLK